MCLKVTPYWLRGTYLPTSLALKSFLVLGCKYYWLWTHPELCKAFVPLWLPKVSKSPFSSSLLRSHTARETTGGCKIWLPEWGNSNLCLSSQDGWVTPQPAVHHFYGWQGTCHLSSICTKHLPGPFQAEEGPGVAVRLCNTPHIWAKPNAPYILGFSNTSSVVNLVPQSLEFKNLLKR